MLEKIKKKIPTFIIAIAIPLAVGAISALLTRGNMDIYSEVATPPLAPPPIVFPIVWTALYILMGISSGMIYERREISLDVARHGIFYYALSLIFNFFWSIIFFNMRAFLFAFIWLIILLWLVIKTFCEYKKLSLPAALLQLPYIVWLVIAGYLNIGIVLLN